MWLTMHKRAVRVTMLALLLASGLAAALLVWNTDRALHALERDHNDIEASLDGIAPALAAIAAAQQAYIDRGQRDETSFARVSELLNDVTSHASGLRPRTPESTAQLEEFWAALSAMTAADAQAKQALAGGETLAAADAVFVASRSHVTILDARLRGFRDSERRAASDARRAALQRAWIGLAAAGVFWFGGLVALSRQAPTAAMAPPPPARSSVDDAQQAEPPAPPATVDLDATAAVCGEISRLNDSSALPRTLQRAADVLDAHGLILWLGAGDELFPVTSVGYDASVVVRLRPIGRGASNATADAWRLGRLRTVAADSRSLGAIVAPMTDASGCIGVLAAEVRNGREQDRATCAVTAIIASQLATVVSAWPAASTREDAAAGASATLPDANAQSNRHAAAS